MKQPFFCFLGIMALCSFVAPSLVYAQQHETTTELFNKALTLTRQADLAGALACYTELLQHAPNHVSALYNKAHTLKEIGCVDEALSIYEQIAEYDPNNHAALLGRAQCYLTRGNFTEGFKGLIHRHPLIKEFGTHHLMYADLKNKRVLIRGEWGFGDMFQFIRYAQLLKERGAYVIVQAYQELLPLLKLCPYIDHVFTNGEDFPEHDAQLPLLSLPESFGTTLGIIPNTVPYLYADPKLKQQWKERLSTEKRFKIGICCSGNGNKEAHKFVQKNIPPECLRPLALNNNVALYLVQQPDSIKSSLPIASFNEPFDHEHGRFMDTAAILQNLDLVITIDTSIAHLAGALDVPVWVLLPYTADWRWLKGRDDSPWYPSMKLFRQQEPGNWDTVVTAVQQALEPLLARHEQYLQLCNATTLQELFDNAGSMLKAGQLFYAQQLYEQVLAKAPRSLGTLHNLAYTLRWQGKTTEAIECYRKELAYEDKADAHFGLAQAYLLEGNYQQGLEEFERGRSESLEHLTKKLTTLDDINNKTVLILPEWGLGDMLQCIRYVYLLKQRGARTVLRAPSPLYNLLCRCPYVDKVLKQHEPAGEQIDAVTSVLSLPYLFKTSIENIPTPIPYLHPSPDLVEQWRPLFANNKILKIGICWQGSTHNAYPDKNIPIKFFETLSALQNVQLYSLQKITNDTDQINVAKLGMHDFGKNFDTDHGPFMDTAAIMQHLDLVITIDTSVAHLAGGLGVPVWLLLPKVPDWRWMLNRTDSPWYPTMRLFRQHQYGDWHNVIQQVVEVIKEIKQ